MTKHKHLARLESVWVEHPVFDVTVCTIDRRAELANERMHAICREVWANCEALYGWVVGRYVLMPDHAHFFCFPLRETVAGVCDPVGKRDDGANDAGLLEASYKKVYKVSTFVGKWKEWTAKYAHRRYGVVVPLWQPEFFDHVLRSWESYEKKWHYVRDNPLRAGLVAKPDDWPYQGEIHPLAELYH